MQDLLVRRTTEQVTIHLCNGYKINPSVYTQVTRHIDAEAPTFRFEYRAQQWRTQEFWMGWRANQWECSVVWGQKIVLYFFYKQPILTHSDTLLS